MSISESLNSYLLGPQIKAARNNPYKLWAPSVLQEKELEKQRMLRLLNIKGLWLAIKTGIAL